MAARTPITPEQFDPQAFPRKLNLGSGSDVREGYLNIDMNAWHGPDVVADIRKLSFLPSQQYDELVAYDVLEHLPRTETLRVLMLWNRPLRAGGTIDIEVPSAPAIAGLMALPENSAPEKQEELVQCLFGTQAYQGDFHLTSFSEPLVRHYLEQAGFAVASLTLVRGWLIRARAHKVAHIEEPPLPDLSVLQGIEDDREFVRACFRQILQREADPVGEAYYLDGMRAGGMPRQVVVDAMLGGAEYRTVRHAVALPFARPRADPAPAAALPEPRLPRRPPEPLAFAWFASLHGRELVEACYVHLLGRDADPAGLQHHLGALVQGEEKAFVVGSIRYSEEGRRRAVPVAGLFAHFAAAAAQRLPLVGIFAGWLVALLTVNSRLRHARALEEHLRARLDAIGDSVEHSSAQVALRIEALRAVLESRG